MIDTDIKYFTPEEANKTLPLVKKIVKDILDYSFELKTISDSTGGEIEDNREAKSLISSIKGFMAELEEIGCYYKDWNFSVGLVDFPGIIDNEEVFLCWKSDEEKVMYYHGLNEGFRGRKLIPEYYFDTAEI
ncbi:MAG: DUF2203 domain-containing protein [Ignavibacteriae bacterium]|nr:DUF2203 domain-containing protein [Ignavibacteriota bacterium]MCB9207995.1 DUF2203 domain-containing protein [Ignavibacteriales bacterium]MCB9258764.1 DUF2203 domain-containing protein [Ignavibacteriales bacterium]